VPYYIETGVHYLRRVSCPVQRQTKMIYLPSGERCHSVRQRGNQSAKVMASPLLVKVAYALICTCGNFKRHITDSCTVHQRMTRPPRRILSSSHHRCFTCKKHIKNPSSAHVTVSWFSPSPHSLGYPF
jgi:hypothetical protein